MLFIISFFVLFVIIIVCSRDHKYNHVRIHTKADGGKTKFFLTDQTLFDSIYELAEYYKNSPLKSPVFEQVLCAPVPRKVSYNVYQ